MAVPPHDQAMTHAKVAFMRDPKAMFLYTVCFHLKFEWDDTIPTATVDGYTIRINPAFWMKISHEMRVSLLAHETGHVIREHMARRGNRDPLLYNFAGDYVINQEQKEAGYAAIEWTLDDGRKTRWLQDDRFAGMTTEQVYDILVSEQPPPPPPNSGGGGVGDPDPNEHWKDLREPSKDDQGKPVTPADVKQHINEIIVSAAQAATISGNAGSIPGDVQLFLESLLKPKLPMAAHLRRFFTALAKNDYTWQRPNKRFMPLYMPSLRSEKLTELAFAYDVSGSVKDYDLKRYHSELVGVMRNLKPDKLTLILFDHGIRSVHTIKTLKELMDVKIIGRGGTEIEPVLAWAKKNKPTALIVFTDGEFYQHENIRPGCPVLWMIHNKRRKFSWPFGTVIPFEV